MSKFKRYHVPPEVARPVYPSTVLFDVTLAGEGEERAGVPWGRQVRQGAGGGRGGGGGGVGGGGSGLPVFHVSCTSERSEHG